jgi:phage replication-related protein YjqB (UPF0714/DUF867 family)
MGTFRKNLIQLSLGLLILLSGSRVFAFLDVYPDFIALRSDKSLDPQVDYSISLEDRKSEVTVMAIHGGIIEPPTDLAAQLFAQKYGFNSYLFRSNYAGPGQADTMYLHVTATHFNDPDLLSLAARSNVCVSFHGNDAKGRVACIGGGDQNLRKKVAERLVDAKLDQKLEMLIDANADGNGWKNPTCRKYKGTHPENIVNRCAHGLQLELSLELREKLSLLEDRPLLEAFLDAIRNAIF